MNDLKIIPIEQNGQRVLTTAQLAEAYGTTTKVISKNFTRNRNRYVEGIHFYRLTGEEKREFCNRRQIDDGSKATVFYLWTERGTLLHAKSLNTDKAWDVYIFLVETYFRVEELEKNYIDRICQKLETLEQEHKAYKKTNTMLLQELKAIKHELEMSEKRDSIIYQKLEMSEKRIDTLETNIEKSITDNLYYAVQTIVPGFGILYKKINRIIYSNYNKYKKKK